MRLDRIDCEIIRLLQNNARISNKELAAQVNLAPSTCLERVRRLQAGEVFEGFHAHIRARSVGIGLQAMIAIRLSKHTRTNALSFRDYALSCPEVTDVYHLAGENDFLVRVVVRDTDHLRTLAMDAFTNRPEVSYIQTAIIFEHVRNPVLPVFLDLESG